MSALVAPLIVIGLAVILVAASRLERWAQGDADPAAVAVDGAATGPGPVA